ncbi:MAG TPA: hypothetical protein VMN78_03785 [Longimicrobiales bacterium]|nr:hypothetical protein [Longimicrobiales bacterium]
MRAMPLLVLLASTALPAAAQRTACVVVDIDPSGYARNLAGPGGTNILFVSGPVEIHCGAGTIVRADSAHSLGSELRLIRNVFYQDSAQVMTATTANYFRDEGRLIARGDVVVRDREGPSVVRGTELLYERVTPSRPEARIVVRGRPRAYLYEAGTPALPPGLAPSPAARVVAGDTIPAALQVDGDRLELQGEDRVLVHGRVQLIRENLRAFGDAADYDRAAGRLELTSNARLEGEGYELFGERITATMPGEQLERVLAEGNAMLMGDELQVRAPIIDIGLADGEVERMIAVSRDEGVLASAVADDFSLIADSIQADAPASVVERITAVGNAYGERAVDSASAALPELVRSDWLRGDTIVGTFIRLAAADTAEGDTARTVLETLTASGSARSLYRMASADAEAERPAVNYMSASRIALRFSEGEVSEVEADGPVEGVHLEPIRAASVDPDAEAEPLDGDAADPGADVEGATSSRGPEASR